MGDLIGLTPDDIPIITADDLNLSEPMFVWKNSRFYQLSVSELFSAATRVPKGFVSERLTVYNDSGDLEHDIGINPALVPCRDDSDAFTFQPLAVIVKQIDAGWAEGTNAGGMDTGNVTANQVYYLWYIYKPTTNHIDAVYSLSKTSPMLPAGYTYKCRIMTVLTDASANIIPFDQDGNVVTFRQPIQNRAWAVVGATTRTALSITAPPNCPADIKFSSAFGSAVNHYLWVDSENRSNASAPSATNNDLNPNSSTSVALCKKVKTNASRQIYYRSDDANVYLELTCYGWIDDRGSAAA